MTDTTAKGSFDVKTIPQKPEAAPEFAGIARLLLDKVFHGELDATSHGQMLASGGEAGWGVYVAIETVTGTLGGREGSFVLYHGGTMTAEGQSLVVRVAPGSGTGALAGLTGTMQIINDNGAHSYIFDYCVPAVK